MSHKNHLSFLTLLLLLTFQVGCKSSTAPNNNNSGTGGGSGSLIFGEVVDEVASATLGSSTSTIQFHGKDPSWTSDGRVIFDQWGSYSADGLEHSMVASVNGTGAQSIVNMEESNSDVYSHPRMSPDGKYISFNYDDNLGNKLGTKYGTLIYTTGGVGVVIAEGVWDASWAPDGSLVGAGSVYSIDQANYITPNAAGLFRIAKDFSAVTPIGSGLTLPVYPVVSPDGSKIAFAMNNHIWTLSSDGSGAAKQITTGPNLESYSCWSPDGTLIGTKSSGQFGFGSGAGLALVSANPSAPVTLSQSESVWVQDKNNSDGVLAPFGNVSWK